MTLLSAGFCGRPSFMTDTWTILGVWPSVNGQFKVTARRGACVINADRLTADGVASFDPQAFWENGLKRPAPADGSRILGLI